MVIVEAVLVIGGIVAMVAIPTLLMWAVTK